ncbi:radical SAM protein [Aquiflexum gelatinilyticum]|uniref:radical SAM protein n=1 Tax=Aquiflexum gelatinilyticum TaxID=2961943 RepID=UPI0021685251|nr:radical SAM protein [Aquiflexum gelatinilyticum]MCS4434252.1 radical SAM protein [Aquiflexum gelatinilyticum]
MEETVIKSTGTINPNLTNTGEESYSGLNLSIKRNAPGYFTRIFIRIWVNFHIAILALRAYASLKKTKIALGGLQEFKRKAFGKNGRRKFSVKNNQYWFGLYVPPFPSRNFDRLILTELNRYVPHSLPINAYQQVNFAITTKCPMRCEHCFEWDNLNLRETFSLSQLQEIVKKLQNNGLGHISLSGGEPLVRFEDMLELIKSGEKSTEWWVLTSGFNLTDQKAIQLKKAGATGIVISLDHHDPEINNKFRGHKDAFGHAVRAAEATVKAGLSLAISVCVTRENANREFLMNHTTLCESLGADFIQWLEPRAEGHFRDKEVMLQPDQITILEELFVEFNHDPKNNHFPPVMYHGYHQRRVGCMSGGKFSFYVDALGMVHSCPFCHSSDFKITDWLEIPKIGRKEITACKEF